MKNILFATTALVATAGIASADVSLSGAANVGIINNGTAAAKDVMYQNMTVTATMSGETDNGLTFGASLGIRKGDDVDLDAGDLGKAQNLLGATDLSATNFGSVFVSGGFGTITFDEGGIDNLMDDGSASHDVKYAYSAGALSLTATMALEDVAAADATALGDDWSLSVVYAMAPATVTVKTDDAGETDVTVAYVASDALTLSVNMDSDGQTTDETTVTAKYTTGGLTASLSLMDDDDDAWAASLGYTAGAMTFSAALGENDGAGDTEMDLSASYDLGGGMSIKGATNESGAWFVGTALAF